MNVIVGTPQERSRRRLAIGFIGAAATVLTLFVTSAPTAQAAASPRPAPASFGVSGLSSAPAGTEQTVKVTALLNGKPNANYRGTVVLTSTDAQDALPAPYTFTAKDKGVRSFPVTLKTSGSQKVTATDSVTSTITGSQTVTVSPGPAGAFALSGLAAMTAGAPQSMTLTFNNVATGYRGTVHFTSSDPQAALPTYHTFIAADAGFSSTAHPGTGRVHDGRDGSPPRCRRQRGDVRPSEGVCRSSERRADSLSGGVAPG